MSKADAWDYMLPACLALLLCSFLCDKPKPKPPAPTMTQAQIDRSVKMLTEFGNTAVDAHRRVIELEKQVKQMKKQPLPDPLKVKL